MNVAAKLYLFYLGTDIDLYFLSRGSRSRRYGADFCRNLATDLEVHGECARIGSQEAARLDAAGNMRCRAATRRTSWSSIATARAFSEESIECAGADLHGRIGIVFQDFVPFHFTAGENIAIGRIDARAEQGRIVGAAKSSRADEVIGRLPLGYEQPLAKRFRNGTELSGGEWQKIALARAYMRDADVLILDEPTAALDTRAECEVFSRLKELARGKSALLISHCFSTVKMADRILVLHEGALAELGSHAELMRAGGRYAELFELQATAYRGRSDTAFCGGNLAGRHRCDPLMGS